MYFILLLKHCVTERNEQQNRRWRDARRRRVYCGRRRGCGQHRLTGAGHFKSTVLVARTRRDTQRTARFVAVVHHGVCAGTLRAVAGNRRAAVFVARTVRDHAVSTNNLAAARQAGNAHARGRQQRRVAFGTQSSHLIVAVACLFAVNKPVDKKKKKPYIRSSWCSMASTGRCTQPDRQCTKPAEVERIPAAAAALSYTLDAGQPTLSLNTAMSSGIAVPGAAVPSSHISEATSSVNFTWRDSNNDDLAPFCNAQRGSVGLWSITLMGFGAVLFGCLLQTSEA